MSRASVAPGPRSIEGLAWLARVGASPLEPWRLVMGWSRAVGYDHARRLAAAGLVRTVRMTQGDGSLFVTTAAGAARVGYPASWALRSIGPSTWAHACACAWVSAWLQVVGAAGGANESSSTTRSGDSTCGTPTIAGQGGSRTVRTSPRKPPPARSPSRWSSGASLARLLGILRMYAECTDGNEAPLAGVLYVCDRADVADAVGGPPRRRGWMRGR